MELAEQLLARMDAHVAAEQEPGTEQGGVAHGGPPGPWPLVRTFIPSGAARRALGAARQGRTAAFVRN